MSDHKTNVEMDDVLSSIRELVSDKDTSETGRKPPSDRFVLTPALMVVQGAKPAPSEKPAQIEPEPQVSAEFLAMERAWQEELRRMKERREGKNAGESASEHSQVSLEERIAELEAAVGQAEDEWEPDGSEPDAQRPVRHRLFEVIENPQPPQPEKQEAPETPAVPPTSVPEPAATPEPVFSHSDAPFILSKSLQTSPEKKAPEEKNQAQLTNKSTKAELVDDDDVYLDLDALRDMITEVVREELRGRLGETITRNVRRMVRSEIDRAISKYDPED